MNFCCQLADIQPMILTMGGLVLSWGFSGTFCGWVNMPWGRPGTTAADKAAKELGGDDNDRQCLARAWCRRRQTDQARMNSIERATVQTSRPIKRRISETVKGNRSSFRGDLFFCGLQLKRLTARHRQES
jgi:hypothetical protein